jgi:hypothetical protein
MCAAVGPGAAIAVLSDELAPGIEPRFASRADDDLHA